jgi:hypothetical protein
VAAPISDLGIFFCPTGNRAQPTTIGGNAISDKEFWELWCESTSAPTERIKRHAKVRKIDGRRWITYPDEINGTKVIVEMPEDAHTKSCDQGRHDDCPHRLGGPQEGGALLKLSSPSFRWRCGCPCHRDPFRAGRLF